MIKFNLDNKQYEKNGYDYAKWNQYDWGNNSLDNDVSSDLTNDVFEFKYDNTKKIYFFFLKNDNNRHYMEDDNPNYGSLIKIKVVGNIDEYFNENYEYSNFNIILDRKDSWFYGSFAESGTYDTTFKFYGSFDLKTEVLTRKVNLKDGEAKFGYE